MKKLSERPQRLASQHSEPAYRAPALEKGIAILELLANARAPMSVIDMAAALQRSRAEIYRMLVVLEALGYIHRADDGSFDLTPRLFDLAIRHTPRRSIVTAARPVMEELAEKTLQSCHLAINSGEHMVCIAREESSAPIGFTVQVGFRPQLLHSTSGRVYFAFQGPERQELLLRRIKHGDSKSLRALRATARRIVERGYLREPSHLTAGIEDLSAPVFSDETGQAVACLAIPFISHRLFDMDIDRAIELLLESARQISKRLQNGAKAHRRSVG